MIHLHNEECGESGGIQYDNKIILHGCSRFFVCISYNMHHGAKAEEKIINTNSRRQSAIVAAVVVHFVELISGTDAPARFS